MRRASISVATNIAEGFKKKGVSDKIRFLNIAQGSLEECRYYLILIQDLGYSPTTELEKSLEEVSKLLGAYVSAMWALGLLGLVQNVADPAADAAGVLLEAQRRKTRVRPATDLDDDF